MSNTCCVGRWNCTGIAVVASIIIGIITAMLRFMGIITVTPAFLWVVFGIAVGFLAIALIVSAFGFSGARRCAYIGVPALLLGILGTILTSVILLAINFVATSVVGAIISGLLLAAFSLIITAAACLVRCAVGYVEA